MGAAFAPGFPGLGCRHAARIVADRESAKLRERIHEMNVLIVDDDLDHIHSLKRWLISEGHRVGCARDGRQVLARLDQETWHVVLVHLVTARANGLTVIGDIRQEGFNPVIVAYASFMDLGIALLAAAEGANRCLRKPLRPVELRPLLSRAASRGGSPLCPRT